MGEDGATCFHTFTPDTRDLTKPEWDELRFGQLCTSADTFADWKVTIEKLCSASQRCTYKQAKNLRKIIAALEKVKDKTGR
jgi:hypothetical protein